MNPDELKERLITIYESSYDPIRDTLDLMVELLCETDYEDSVEILRDIIRYNL